MPNLKISRSGRVTIRRARLEDIPQIIACSQSAYADYPPNEIYDEGLYEMQIKAFPDGQFVALSGSRVVGYATSLIVSLDEDEYGYSVDEISGSGTFSTHDNTGDTLYGADIAVDPDFRRRGISGMPYERRKSLLTRLNLRRMIAYGRIPGYREHAGK
ncbi:MAG: GNAT family N-acetyltransferase [bacterium]|nr:GNAT family N-acetyltransferase [bacterium]